MNKELFLLEMEKSLEVENLKPETFLEEISWDSLSVIIFISLVDKIFQISLTPVDIKDCQTIQDLLDKISFKP